MKVSVCMITYNHAEFIAQAIESVLTQQAPFDIELVIGEDASSDDTPAIIRRYQRKYPELIRPTFSESPLGIAANFARTIHACSGQYVALMDGDDYWISPRKLQIQAEFLDYHLDYSMCFHGVQRVSVDQQPASVVSVNAGYDVTLDDLLVYNRIATASVMLRSAALGRLPDWFTDLPMEDWPLYILLASRGKIRELAEVLAAYRIHDGGAWSSASATKRGRDLAAVLESIDAHVPLNARQRKIVNRSLSQLHWQIAIHQFELRDPDTARNELARATELDPELLGSDRLLAAPLMYVRSGYDAATNEQFIRRLFAELLGRSSEVLQSRVLSAFYMKEVFEALARNDETRIGCNLWRGLRYDPRWLWNRGVLTTAARRVFAHVQSISPVHV